MSTVLVVGSGGREHALAWKLAQSPQVSRLIVAPGNDGMKADWEHWEVSLSKGQSAFLELASRAQKERVDLAVIGPDNPLSEGTVDLFLENGILTFGPRAAASQIEASKIFAKKIMQKAGIPTARYWVVQSEDEAHTLLKSLPWDSSPGGALNLGGALNPGWVLKADGLAFGKGVHVCDSLAQALQSASELYPISKKLLIEERLQGVEVSWMAFCDGERCSIFEPARDYKRLLDGNRGPNTGGMGAISPLPELTESQKKAWKEKMRSEVFVPILREMKAQGAEFRGLLYAGLIVNFQTQEYWVLEFNSRFGDPEAQVLLPRMQGDLYSWCEAGARGDLREFPMFVPFKDECSVFVVAAHGEYPYRSIPEKPILFKTDLGQSSYFFSGVRKDPGKPNQLYTQGGRVLGALGMGTSWVSARNEAYQRLSQVTFEGMRFRMDIGEEDRQEKVRDV